MPLATKRDAPNGQSTQHDYNTPDASLLAEPAASASAVDPRFVARERQPGLDLLRAVAVLLVIVYHGGIFGFALPHGWQRFGWVGVDLFFVLSGYLIGGQLIAPLLRGQPLDLQRFFWRRALRILPAYLAVLAIYVLAPAWREFPKMPPAWRFLLFVQNFDLQGGTAFSHAWSLCVEGQFYLILPFLLLVVAHWQRRRGAGAGAGLGVGVALGVVLAGLALRAMVAYLNLNADGKMPGNIFQTQIYYATITRLDPLVLGVSLAAVEQCRPHWWKRLLDSAAWLWAPGLAAIAGGLSLGELGPTLPTAVWEFPLIALGMTTLLVCAVSERLPFRRRAVPGAAFLASVSYSVYLIHKLAMHQVIGLCAVLGLAQNSAAAITLNLAGMVLAGAALFFAVERPFLQLRRKSS